MPGIEITLTVVGIGLMVVATIFAIARRGTGASNRISGIYTKIKGNVSQSIANSDKKVVRDLSSDWASLTVGIFGLILTIIGMYLEYFQLK